MDARWEVGSTQGVGGLNGYSFSIQDAHGAPLLTVMYKSEAESSEAETAVRAALEGAIYIAKSP